MNSNYLNIIIASALIFTSSCGLIPEKKSEAPKNDNGVTVVKSYYEKSGDLKSEITVKNNKKNGPAKKYYPTGELHTLVNYVDNIKEGETYWYYKNGNPYRVTPYLKGKMHGTRVIYYENGKIKAEIPYLNGELSESTKEYTKQGELILNQPKLEFEATNLLEYENNFYLKIKLSKKCRKTKYFIEKISTEGTKILAPISINQHGYGVLKFYLPEGDSQNTVLKIFAQYETSLGHPALISDSYKLAIKNR